MDKCLLASFLKEGESEGLSPSWGPSKNSIGINDFRRRRASDAASLPALA
jgi:hypothetical protein